jgi:hypothetical protein
MKKFVVINYNNDESPHSYVVDGLESLLIEVISLTRQGVKFAVYAVGECIGDFS